MRRNLRAGAALRAQRKTEERKSDGEFDADSYVSPYPDLPRPHITLGFRSHETPHNLPPYA